MAVHRLGKSQVNGIVLEKTLLGLETFVHLPQQWAKQTFEGAVAVWALFCADDFDDIAAVHDLSRIVIRHLLNVVGVAKLLHQQLDLGRIL